MRKRSKHNLSHYTLRTANLGQLFPLTCVPVLAGDSFQHSTSLVIRVSPLNTPVMHPVMVRLHNWFVPNRIVHGGWEDFITGGNDGQSSAQIPTVEMSTDKKGLYQYMFGTPPFVGIDVNANPLAAFNEIYNKRYRDQDLAAVRGTTDQTLPRVAWSKDYFTTARPFSQRGPAVTIPVGGDADVFVNTNASSAELNILDQSKTPRTVDSSGADAVLGGTGSGVRLKADLANATGVDINTFRIGFALQRYQEARARYGARFVEYLRYLGIKPSDSRLQEPEYLSGGRAMVNFSEVLQTSPSETPGQAGVGDMYGHGISAMRTRPYRKFFEEHGYVFTLASVVPKSVYLNGIHRELQKTTKEDYFQRELANLGQQEIWKSELYGENQKNTFGFQDRYEEYRHHPSTIGQDFRDTLASWHFGRDIPNDVALNESFIECNPSDEPFQVPPATADTLWVMANHKIIARRLVPKRANPRVL